MLHPNYHNGKIHYPPNPISQPPPTSATSTARMTSNQTKSTRTTTTATKRATSSSNTISTMAGETHRIHTVFAPMTFGGIPHQNKPSSCS